MSEDEYWTGNAKVVKPQDGEDLESLCKRLCEERGYEKTEYHNAYEEVLQENSYKELVIVDGVVYDTSEMESDDSGEICEASRIDEDTVRVTLKFYNGGTCFSEMFEAAVQKLKQAASN